MDQRVKEIYDSATIHEIQNNLKASESEIKRLESAIDIAFRAGVDVTDQRKSLENMKGQYRKMKAVFGA